MTAGVSRFVRAANTKSVQRDFLGRRAARYPHAMAKSLRRVVRTGVVLAVIGAVVGGFVSWRDRRADAARRKDEADFARASAGIWPAVPRADGAGVVIDASAARRDEQADEV